MNPYSPTVSDFTNASAWAQKAAAQLQTGPAIPPPPAGVLGEVSSVLDPLPAGVSFDTAIGLGVIRFGHDVGIVDPDKAAAPYFFSGALNSLRKGSLEYAHVAYNTITEEFEEQIEQLLQVGKVVKATGTNNITGLPGFDTSSGENISPAIRVIPYEYNTVPKAVEFINDPVAARAKYGPK